MNDKDLSKYYKLKKEVEDLENRIKEFGDGVSGIEIKDIMITSTTPNSSIQERLMALKDAYIEKRLSALEQYWKIASYIESVDDPEIRTIMRLRNLDLLTWNEIADKLSSESKDVSEYSVKHKYYRYFKKNAK